MYVLLRVMMRRTKTVASVWFRALQNLPQTELPEVFGMHDNISILRELQETKQLFENVLLTQGQRDGGTGDTTDEQLYTIAADILKKVTAHIAT